jgi:hypothetical protein
MKMVFVLHMSGLEQPEVQQGPEEDNRAKHETFSAELLQLQLWSIQLVSKGQAGSALNCGILIIISIVVPVRKVRTLVLASRASGQHQAENLNGLRMHRHLRKHQGSIRLEYKPETLLDKIRHVGGLEGAYN